jgi:hypothetical protein
MIVSYATTIKSGRSHFNRADLAVYAAFLTARRNPLSLHAALGYSEHIEIPQPQRRTP